EQDEDDDHREPEGHEDADDPSQPHLSLASRSTALTSFCCSFSQHRMRAASSELRFHWSTRPRSRAATVSAIAAGSTLARSTPTSCSRTVGAMPGVSVTHTARPAMMYSNSLLG